MKVRKLTKEEIVAAEQKPKQMTSMNHIEQENHWMPQDVIQGSKNKNKTALPEQVVVKKRIDKRKFQTVKIHILYQVYMLFLTLGNFVTQHFLPLFEDFQAISKRLSEDFKGKM